MENRVIVRLENVSKKYGNTTVIENISLDIYEGEFITLLGSSGCGKTTIFLFKFCFTIKNIKNMLV